MSLMQRPRQSARGQRRSRGFTLVEVMVSLVVLSIGLLGIAKLMLVASHSNDSAYLRSQATELAYAILDNMRANRQTAMTQGYDTPMTSAAANPGFVCEGTASPCTPGQIALYDVYRWKLSLTTPPVGNGTLPNGLGSIVTTTTIPTTATITVQWDDTVAQSAFAPSAVGVAAPMSITLETVL
jgi:type IV pilus assembly protein PilV